MDMMFPSGKKGSAAEFFERLRRQERKDEKFVLYKRIIPLLVGLVLFGIVMITAPIRTPVMFTGAALLFLSILGALTLFFKFYHDISRETFGASLAQFIREKEKRMSYWRSTPFIHQLAFALFLIGWFLINIGNKPFILTFGGFPFGIFIGAVLAVIILLNINSERLYRKRHKEEHEPLLEMIREMREALQEEK